jgi:hypothetical protein
MGRGVSVSDMEGGAESAGAGGIIIAMTLLGYW